MSRAARISVLGGAALVLLGALYLWDVRGAAIMIDYVLAACL
jgi:hypothetical protein